MHMEINIKPPSSPAPEKPAADTGSALRALGIFAAVILVILAVWFVFAPKAQAPESVNEETATTTEKNTQTAAPKKSSTSSGSATSSAYPAAGSRIFENGVYVTIVHFTGKAFVPEVVTVEGTEEVRFINVSNLTMSVASQQGTASSPAYSSFKQPAPKGKGGTYQLAFTTPGIFAYANTPTPSIVGSVFVK